MPKLSNPSEINLWEYALKVYALPGVQPLCLRLQTAGADVCLLLTAAWLGERGVACERERVAQLQAIAQPWRQVAVEPLRALRQSWQEGATRDPELAVLREQVKALELQAERALLERLQAYSARWPSQSVEHGAAWLEGAAGGAAELDHPALEELRRTVFSSA